MAGWFSASVAPAALVIDGFTDFQFVEVYGVNAPNPASGSVSSPSMLGGQRNITVTRTSGNGGGIFVDVNGTAEHAITYSSDPATAGFALISYPNLGGFDLTQGGTNQWIEVSTTSDLGANVIITVYSDATHFSTATVPVAADPTYAFTVAQVPFVEFVAAGPDGGATFTSVSAITLQLDGSKAAVDMIVHHVIADGIPPQTTDDPPTLTCPPDITVQISKCGSSAVVTFDDPVVTVDPDCEPATVTIEPPSGSTFPVGTTPVLVIVTDACGQAATCTFNVTVTKETSQPPKPPCDGHPKPPCDGHDQDKDCHRGDRDGKCGDKDRDHKDRDGKCEDKDRDHGDRDGKCGDKDRDHGDRVEKCSSDKQSNGDKSDCQPQKPSCNSQNSGWQAFLKRFCGR